MPSNFKKMVQARMAKTGESWQTAAGHVRGVGAAAKRLPVPAQSADRMDHVQLRDPTTIIASALMAGLVREFPGSRVDHSRGGLFAGDDRTPAAERVFKSHFLTAHVPRRGGTTRIEIEVRTGERRQETSTFRVWAWIDKRDHTRPAFDGSIDLLAASEIDECVLDIVEAVAARTPNGVPLVPGQQLRFAVRNQLHSLPRQSGPTIVIQAPSLRPQNVKGPFIEVVRTVPVEMLISNGDGAADETLRCTYEGPLYVDDTDASWAERIGGLALRLRAELGDSCEEVELLSPRKRNAVHVRAHFRVRTHG